MLSNQKIIIDNQAIIIENQNTIINKLTNTTHKSDLQSFAEITKLNINSAIQTTYLLMSSSRSTLLCLISPNISVQHHRLYLIYIV